MQKLWQQLTKLPPLYLGIAAALVVLLGVGAYYSLHDGAPGPGAKMQALKQALDAGLITQDEYATKLAALQQAAGGDNAAGSPSFADKFDALNQAYKNGLMTQDEYNTKLAALTAQYSGDMSGAAAPPSGEPSGAPTSVPDGGQFRLTDGTSGGHILVGEMGKLDDPGAAAASILKKVHEELGAKPEIVQAMSDPANHSATFVFTADQNGQTIAGIGFANAPPGDNATAYVVYDTAQNFNASSGALLERVAGVSNAVAPPEPMTQHQFTDGSGSIDVPDDWRLTVASGGTATVLGPTGELVAYNLDMNAMDPNNPTGQNYLRSLPPITRNYTLQTNVMLSPISDPARAWLALYAQRAAQNGTRAPIFNIRQEQLFELPQGGVQSHNAFISGDATLPSPNGQQAGQFAATVQIMPPNAMGQWSMISTWTFVADSELNHYARTAAAIMASVNINFGVVNAQGQATREMFQRQFDTMIATAQQADRDRQHRSDVFMAGMATHEDNMQKQATAVVNSVLDRAVIRNDATGEHFMVDSGFSSDWVRANPSYHVLAPSELVGGVDY